MYINPKSLAETRPYRLPYEIYSTINPCYYFRPSIYGYNFFIFYKYCHSLLLLITIVEFIFLDQKRVICLLR